MRRAEWRVRAGDPTTAFGWWWRSVAPRVRVVFALAPLVVAYIAAVAGAGWIWMVIAFANLAFQMARPWRDDFDALREQLPEPAPEKRFFDTVVYRRDGVVTGRDRLAYTVVDGWLIGEGVRSEFALRPQDVTRLELSTNLAPTFQEGAAGVLELTDGAQIVLTHPDHDEWTALSRWHEGERPEGEPTFPPARVHPREFVRWGGWTIFGMLLSGVGSFMPLLGWLGFSLKQGTWLIGLVLTIWGARRWWRAMKIEVREQNRRALAGQAAPQLENAPEMRR